MNIFYHQPEITDNLNNWWKLIVFIQPEVCPKSSELLECLFEHLILHTYGLDKTRMPERQLHHLQYLLGQSLQLCTPRLSSLHSLWNFSLVYWVADIQEIRLEAKNRPLPYLTPGQLCIATTWGCSWPPCHPDPLITNRVIQHNNTDALLALLPFQQDCVHSEHLQLVHLSKRESHHRIVIIDSVLHWADG